MAHIKMKVLCAGGLQNGLSEKELNMCLQINYCKGMSPTCMFNVTTVDAFIT